MITAWRSPRRGGYKAWVISNNSFEKNADALAGLRTLNDTSITLNEFSDNGSVARYGYFFGNVQFAQNNFVSTGLVLRAPEIGYGYGTVTLANNWWGTSNTSIVDSLIVDGRDDARLQIVEYQPVVLEPIGIAGAKFYPEDTGVAPPIVDITSQDDCFNALELSSFRVAVSGASEPYAAVSVTLSDLNTRTLADKSGYWSASFFGSNIAALPEGQLELRSQQKDLAGHISADNHKVICKDTIAPAPPTINAIARDDIVKPSERRKGLVVSGGVEAGLPVTVTFASFTKLAIANKKGGWSIALTTSEAALLPTGTIGVVAVTEDAVGNRSQTSRYVTNQ